MAPLVLTKPDFTAIPLLNAGLRGIRAGEQRVDLLTADTLTISLESTDPIDIGIGDSLAVYGQLYTLNQVPKVTKNGEHQYSYELNLEGPQYHLLRVIYFDTATSGQALSSTFSLTGTLDLFANVLITNMARVFSGAWALGDVKAMVPGESSWINGTDTDVKTLSFDNENCLGVLQRLCTEFNTEFVIEYLSTQAPNRLLHIKPAGNVLPYVFRYGQGNALYQLIRQPTQQQPFYTRLYIYGSTKNLPYGYRVYSDRLQLPLPSGSPPPQQPSPWDSYVQSQTAINTFGLIEGTKLFEEIFPSRVGVVTNTTGRLTFVDTDIDFNLKQILRYELKNGKSEPVYKYLIPGLTAKVNFLTGGLTGYTFDISDFNPATKQFTIKLYTNEQGVEFPSKDVDSPFRVHPDDKYVLIDLRLPDEYVEAAENKLLDAGQAYLAENSSPSVEYSLTIDENYLQSLAADTGPIPVDVPAIFFAVGDQIRIIDSELAIDRFARILSFSRDLLRPYKYTMTLGAARRVSVLEKILRTQAKVNRVLDNSGLTDTTPVVPAGEVTSKEELVDLIKKKLAPFGNAIQLDLRASNKLPTGYIELASGSPTRHDLQADVVQKTGVAEAILGTVKAIGVKQKFIGAIGG